MPFLRYHHYVPELPVIAGFERIDGWYVSARHRPLGERLRRTPPPRRYGVHEQILVDVTTHSSPILYLLVFAAIAYGAVTLDWYYLVLGAAALIFFGRGFVDAIRLVRRGVVSTVIIRHVDRDVGRGQGVNEGMRVADREMNVSFDLGVVRPLLKQGAVEAEVICQPDARRPIAQAFAYRVLSSSPR